MFNKIKENLKKRNLCFDEGATDFTDFHGTVLNSDKEPFEVEGSIECDVENKTISYSIVFYDVNRDIEYDGIIGTFHNVDKSDNIEVLMNRIFAADFVELAWHLQDWCYIINRIKHKELIIWSSKH